MNLLEKLGHIHVPRLLRFARFQMMETNLLNETVLLRTQNMRGPRKFCQSGSNFDNFFLVEWM